jgi:nucleoside 2-deoxyribosyltransferase
MNIFIICSVRGATEDYRKKLEAHVEALEKAGHKVHLPHRDTDQEASGLYICLQNREAIRSSDQIHIFYSSKSQGTHFDMGMALAMGKDIVIVENEPILEGKSFSRMLNEWSMDQMPGVW